LWQERIKIEDSKKINEQMLEVMCQYKFIKQVILFMFLESKNLHQGMFEILQKENLALQVLL
jgi:hypothetical protein